MTATVTDLFCGAGGSSLGAAQGGMQVVMAANHWQTAIDVHQANHPDTAHDCADISQVDPRRYPRTDVLLASPECTNHSQARGVSRRRQDASLFDSPDPAAERSRATMWDVVRFAEQMRYDAVIVENVVEATKWVLWPAWVQAITDLGYRLTLLSHNSMHHSVPQSRDRIYAVWTRQGIDPDLELELEAWCGRCDCVRSVRQAWKNGRTVGRYRQQWIWACVECGEACEPSTEPAATIIDWDLDCPRIGDRSRPLAQATRDRILAGLQRYGWAPIITSGAGNGFERTPGNRARRALVDPLPTQTASASHALATAPFQVQVAHGSTNRARFRSIDEPAFTATGSNVQGLVVPLRRHGAAQTTDESLPTVTAGGNHHGLLMRNNTGGGEMVTPTSEPARTVTTTGHQSLLMPYYGQSKPKPTDEPIGSVTTRDRHALIDPAQIVDDCGFRMLQPYEIAAAMAFPESYIPLDLPKRDQVKLAGNAVTPPVMAWITGRVLQALEAK